MKLTRPGEVIELLRQLDFQPKKSLGQNFLIDGNILNRIVDTSGACEGEHILEIGPGLGVLTEALLARGVTLSAVEKDEALADWLKHRFDVDINLVVGDAVAQNYPEWVHDHGVKRVVSNLPYSVGSRILFDLFHEKARPETITVTVQLDVADRLVAPPGNKQYGILGIVAQAAYEVERVKVIGPRCFYPPPRVKSAVVHFQRRENPIVPDASGDRFRAVVKKCFAQRRKQIKSLLSEEEIARIPDLDVQRRPETLSIEEWAMLAG